VGAIIILTYRQITALFRDFNENNLHALLIAPPPTQQLQPAQLPAPPQQPQGQPQMHAPPLRRSVRRRRAPQRYE